MPTFAKTLSNWTGDLTPHASRLGEHKADEGLRGSPNNVTSPKYFFTLHSNITNDMARGDIYTAVWQYVTDPKLAVHFLTDPKFTKWLSVFLLIVDAVLCALIVKTVPCMKQLRRHLGEKEFFAKCS